MKNNQMTSLHLPAIRQAVVMLDPLRLWRNPVMFLVEVGSLLTTLMALDALIRHTGEGLFASVIALWLWLTLLFANYAESLAEFQGKAQAESLRTTRSEVMARRITEDGSEEVRAPRSEKATAFSSCPGSSSPPTARSSRGWPASTSRPSPGSRPR